MSRTLASKPNTIAPSADYPYGDVKDNSGSNDGTNVNKLLVADFLQFFERLMAIGGITPNGLAENNANGWQYQQALEAVINSLAGTLVGIEASARGSADTSLLNAINSEASTRSSNDTAISGGNWVSTTLANTDVENGSSVDAISVGTSNVYYRIGQKETFINLRIRDVVFGGTPSEIHVLVPAAIRNILNQELRPGGDIFAITGIVNSTSGNVIPCQVLYDGTSRLKFYPISGGFGAASLNSVCCDLVSRFVS